MVVDTVFKSDIDKGLMRKFIIKHVQTLSIVVYVSGKYLKKERCSWYEQLIMLYNYSWIGMTYCENIVCLLTVPDMTYIWHV